MIFLLDRIDSSYNCDGIMDCSYVIRNIKLYILTKITASIHEGKHNVVVN
jgi:hypothetical protein